MKKTFKILLIVVLFWLFLLGAGNASKEEAAITKIGQYIARILTETIGWIFGLLMVIASLFILFAAYKFLTAGGNEDQIKEAKNMIWYAVLAVVVGFLSRGVTYLVETIFKY
jgi:Mn2+/Fe2+ NRAMP family transporter